MNKKITETIFELLKKSEQVIVAIEGPCTSGKTTLAKAFEENFDCNIIHMDDFFLPFKKRTEDRLNEIGGNIDYERFLKEVAENIKDNRPFTYGKFDCSEGKISEEIAVPIKPITVVEGVYSMHPYFGDIYDFKIFIDIDEDTQLKRLKVRSPEKLERFINEWIPMENSYFEQFSIKDNCDFILDNN